MKELWKDIAGFEGYYKISSRGRVKSLRRARTSAHGGYSKTVILKTKGGCEDYVKVSLCKDKKCMYTSCHRLVALHFIPNPENKPQVNHKDGNRQNNNIDNLEWVTVKENVCYSFTMGWHVGNRGIKNGGCKLTEKQVIKIRKLLCKGFTHRYISELFSVSRVAITNIKNKKRWAYL